MTDNDAQTVGNSHGTSMGTVVAMDRRAVLKTTGVTAATATGLAGSAGARKRASVSKERFTIESYDGTELGATLYVPLERGPRPSVLMTHGWGAARSSPLTVPKAMNYAKNGYAVLTYDSRGFAESKGTVELNGPKETRDAQYLIDWLASQPDQYDVEIARDGPGTRQVSFDYPAIQEFPSAGDTVGLEISVTNPWYLDSRDSRGLTVDARNSRLVLPQRPDEDAPAQEAEEAEDCWLFC